MMASVQYTDRGWIIMVLDVSGGFLGFVSDPGKVDFNERMAFFTKEDAEAYMVEHFRSD